MLKNDTFWLFFSLSLKFQWVFLPENVYETFFVIFKHCGTSLRVEKLLSFQFVKAKSQAL